MRSFLLVLVLAATAAQAQSPQPLGAVLGCTDFDSLARPVLWHEGAVAQLASCKSIRRDGSAELECSPHGKLDVLGLPAQEFSLREASDGSHESHAVFKAGIDRVRAAAEKRHGGVFEPEGADGYVMRLPGQPERRVELGLREDGATELSCILAGLPRAGAERTGADANHGEVRGRISFPTRPIPPMRVCAVTVGTVPGGWCAITAEGIGSYTIGSVPPGEYYLLAWPERDNPNRYVAAHAQLLAGCRPLDPNCANGVLERVYVHAGRVLENVNLDQAFTNLPPHLAKPPPLR